MIEVTVKEARKNFRLILDRVERGEDIVITRRGKKVVRMTNLHDERTSLESLKNFRMDIQLKGLSLSQTIIDQRNDERF